MNNKKIFYRSFLITLVLCGLMIGSLATAKEGPEEEKGRLSKVLAFDPEIFAALNINNLITWDRQDGKSNHSPAGNDGVMYPRGTTYSIYQDGLVWGARAYTDAALTQPAPLDQEVRIMGATYGTGSKDGWIEGFGANAVRVPVDNPKARMFRIRRNWKEAFKDEAGDWTNAAIQDAADCYEIAQSAVTDVELELLYAEFQWSWTNWPVELGAPYIDRNGNGVYDPPDAVDPNWTTKSLIEDGLDEPGIAGADPNSPADMVLWNVYNDLYRSLRFGSEPTGMELQNTVWGYARSDALGNMYFRKVRFINKGGVEIDDSGNLGSFWLDSCYVVQWSDPDLGDTGDDLLSCDTLLSVGYVYNGNAVDNKYARFFFPPPAAGYDYLQGPAIPGDPTDVAVFDLKYKPGFKNLGMTGFSYFSAGSPYSDPSNTVYQTGALRWWKMMRGFAPIDGPDEPYRQPPGVTPGPFPLSGDPVLGTGHIDGQGEDYSFVPGDRRLLCITGPWTMAPGDTQEVVIALVTGMGADRISSVSVMKFNDEFAQNTYDALFQVPAPPKEPLVAVTAGNESILLAWSDPTTVKETETVVVNPGEYTFEGYNVYQLPKAGATKQEGTLIATYDVVNENTVVLDRGFDLESGQVLELPVQFGSNAGVKRQFTFARDYIEDFNKITNGKEYYVAITAYSVAKEEVLPKTLESNFTIIPITANDPFGTQYTTSAGDTIPAVHSAGGSDGMIYPIVYDPSKINGHDYKVTFTDVDADGATEFTLTDVTANKLVMEGQTNQTGTGDYLLSDGFQLRVEGAPLAFKDFLVTQDASGAVDYQGAQNWGSFPTTGKNDRVNQSNGTSWFIQAGGASSSAYSVFLDRVANTRGNKWKYLIPHDFEYRFTGLGNGNWANDWDGHYIDVPFEIWNVSQNIRLIPLIYDLEYDQEFNLRAVDHPASGGANDPHTDWVYPQLPNDETPDQGSAGYDAWVAGGDVDDYGNEVMGRNVFMSWNGGDVSDGTLDAVAVKMVETGTVYKIITNKPNAVTDEFTFSTADYVPETNLALQKADVEKVGVFPNPYYAFNNLEINPLARFITFNNLPSDREVTVRVFNLAGQLVRVLDKVEGTQFLKWDLLNQSLIPVASGVYVAYVDMGEVGAKTLKLVVIQEAEVLPVY